MESLTMSSNQKNRYVSFLKKPLKRFFVSGGTSLFPLSPLLFPTIIRLVAQSIYHIKLNIMDPLKNLFSKYLENKALALPTQVKNYIVIVAPWLIAISILMALPAILTLFGLKVRLPELFYYQTVGASNYNLVLIIEAIALVLNVLALPGLFKKSISGWNWVYYSIFVQTLASLVAMNLTGGIIGLIISMYILFQVKSYYQV